MMGRVLWIYGEPCSGKTTMLNAMRGIKLDSHTLRERSGQWDLSSHGRTSSLMRLAATAVIISEQGFDVCVAAVTPRVTDREAIKAIIPKVEMVLADYKVDELKERQHERFGEAYDMAGFEYE